MTGPPLLPWVVAASISIMLCRWMPSMTALRSSPLTVPSLNDSGSPSGKPRAPTWSPTRGAEAAKVRVAPLSGDAVRTSATSAAGSRPMTRPAVDDVPWMMRIT